MSFSVETEKIVNQLIDVEYDFIKCGDCLTLMEELPNECVDLIITSPPYNLGAKHHTGNNYFNAYESYADNLPESEYQNWQIKVLNECFRILKPNGSLFYNHKNRIKNGVQITPYEWLFKTKFLIKQEIVWFNRSQNFDKCRFYPMTERVYWMTKDKNTKLYNAINHHDVFDTKDWKPEGTKGGHKRAFPLKMVEDIIDCFADAKIVFDPFAGSGTTLVGAIKKNKHYIGFELCEDYVEIAKKRISETKENMQQSLF